MIRSTFLIFVLLILGCAVIAMGQGVQTSPTPASPRTGAAQATQSAAASTPVESTVPANAPVITINGVCDVSLNGMPKTVAKGATPGKASTSAAPSTPHSDCKTQVTRAEFEKLMKIAPPHSDPRRIATFYAQVVTAANEGIKLGADKDPDFNEQLAFVRLQLLAQNAQRKVQAEASNVSDADIKAYYDQNPAAFEEVTLTRIFVPRSPTPPVTPTPGSDPKAAMPATPDSKAVAAPAPDAKTIADDARKQLADGGDPEKIQKAAYEQLKTTTEPPTTKFGAKRRGALAPAHEQKVFALKQGDVSDVIQDSVGYSIYRVDSKQVLPLEQARDQIKQRLAQQRMQDAQQKMMAASKADYNDAYFGAEASGPRPGQPAPPTLRPKEAAPSTSPSTGTNPSPTQSANPKK